MAPHALSVGDIRDYCEFFGIRGLDERERLFTVMRKLDAVYMKHEAERSKKAGEKPAAPAGSPPPKKKPASKRP